MLYQDTKMFLLYCNLKKNVREVVYWLVQPPSIILCVGAGFGLPYNNYTETQETDICCNYILKYFGMHDVIRR